MAKGIIYVMKSVVPGLIKIGKTSDFEKRMRELEQNGYRNITGLQRCFAIEVEDYDEKEKLIHTIFEKSRLSDTELFALDDNIVVQLLSAFDGKMIYPLSETKEEVFSEATDNIQGKLIPDGTYKLARKKNEIKATAEIKNGSWTIKKGSRLELKESKAVTKKCKNIRFNMVLDEKGTLLEDYELGECSPSFASDVILYASTDGWEYWKTADGKSINIFRTKESED